MPSFEKPPHINEPNQKARIKTGVFVGVKKNPDGSLDYSHAAEWTPTQEELEEHKKKQPKKKESVVGFKEKKEIVIPRGWTYLKHGTNFLNWQETDLFTAEQIQLNRNLAVITKEDSEKDAKSASSYNTTKNYSYVSKPKGMSDEQYAQLNKPLEIRVLFYKNHIREKTDPEYAEKLNAATKELIAKYYFINEQHGRHPVVPRKEVLIKLDHKVENGVDVFYFVPKTVLAEYLQESEVN